MKIKFRPLTNEELNKSTTFSTKSIAYILCIKRLIHIYYLDQHDAKAIVDDCCLTGKSLISHLRPLMESNPELFV